MKTSELIDHVVEAAGLEKRVARKAVEAVLSGIVDAAVKNEEVVLAGFGKFKVKDSPARTGRNPSSGEPIEIAAARKLVFIAAAQVRTALQG